MITISRCWNSSWRYFVREWAIYTHRAKPAEVACICTRMHDRYARIRFHCSCILYSRKFTNFGQKSAFVLLSWCGCLDPWWKMIDGGLSSPEIKMKRNLWRQNSPLLMHWIQCAHAMVHGLGEYNYFLHCILMNFDKFSMQGRHERWLETEFVTSLKCTCIGTSVILTRIKG